MLHNIYLQVNTRALILVVLLLGAAPRLAHAAISQAELAKQIESAGILEKGYKCSVRIESSLAELTTYQNSGSRSQDNDCKILAVLIAKKVFELSGDLTRVKVKFLDASKSGDCRSVSVSVGDISAYSAGSTSMDSLLSSLEIVRSKEQILADPKNTADKTVRVKSTASESGRQEVPARKILPSGRNVSLVFYLERSSGVRLAYPKSWSLQERPAADLILRCSAADAAQSLEFSAAQTSANPNPQDYLKQYSRVWQKEIPGYQSIESYPVLFGSKLNHAAYLHEFRFKLAEGAFRAIVVFFAKDDHLCIIKLSAPESDLSEFRLLFNDILSRTELQQAERVTAKGSVSGFGSLKQTDKKAGSSGLDQLNQTYKSDSGTVQISYPANFTARKHPDKDTEVSIACTENKAGQMADLRLSSFELTAPMGLEFFQEAYENELQKAQRIKREFQVRNLVCGKRRNLQGIRKFYQLDLNGAQILQQQFFFQSEQRGYVISLSTLGWDAKDSNEFFEKILWAIDARP